jgi:hypothetical protein
MTVRRRFTRRRPVHSGTPADGSAPSLHPPTAGVQRDPRRWQCAVASPADGRCTAGPPPMAVSRRVTPPPAEGRCTAGPPPMAAEPSDHPATRRWPVYSGTTADGRRAVRSPRHPPMAGVQRDKRHTPDFHEQTTHPPEWPVHSGTIGDSRRFLRPTRPPARTTSAQRVHQRLQPIPSTLSTVRMWTRHTNMCLSEHIVWCPRNKTPATQQSIVQHPTSPTAGSQIPAVVTTPRSSVPSRD